jgi:glycerate dehydrogenase
LSGINAAIVVLDGYTLNPGDISWDCLERLGSIKIHDRTEPGDIVERAKNASIVLTNKTPLTSSTIELLPNLKYIGVLATGYNVVDTVAAARKGIVVTNIPSYGTDSVAEMIFALLFELSRRVGHHDAEVRKGRWKGDFCFWDYPQMELAGKTIGIIGFGRIGRRIGEIAHAFSMQVVAFDEYMTNPPSYDEFSWGDLSTVLSISDVITLNCNLTKNNAEMIDAKSIDKMKAGAFIINAARGPLIRERDLADALNSGKIAGAALDVLSVEPISRDNPLLGAKNCIMTPHIAWATKEARSRLMQTAAQNVSAFLEGRPINVVGQ